MTTLHDHNAYPSPRNLDEEYKRKKKKGESYGEWVDRESDNAFTWFVVFLILGVPMALFLMGLLMYILE